MINYNFLKSTLQKNIYSYWLFLMGLEIVIIYIYIRLFIPRYCYTLEYLRLHHTLLHLIIYIDFILLHFAIISSILYTLYRSYYNYTTVSAWVLKLQNILNTCYWNPLLFLHDTVAPHITYSGKIMLQYYKFASYLITKTKQLTVIYILAFCFVFIPRIILVLIFVIEMCYFNKIHYFITLLPLLIMPLCYKVFLKLCESFSERNLPLVEEELMVIPTGEPQKYGIFATFEFTLKQEVFIVYDKDFNFEEYLEELIDYWYAFYNLKLITSSVKYTIYTFESYVSLFCSVMYLIAGIYKLWFVFF